MNDALSQIVNDVLLQLFQLVLYPLIIWIMVTVSTKLRAWIQMKLTEQQLAIVREIVFDTVRYVEQLARKHGLYEDLKERRDAAIAEANRRLESMGIKNVPTETLLSILESGILMGVHVPWSETQLTITEESLDTLKDKS